LHASCFRKAPSREANIWLSTVPHLPGRVADVYLLAAYCTVAARIEGTSRPDSADLEARRELAAQRGLWLPKSRPSRRPTE
jgi:hypothetical protein